MGILKKPYTIAVYDDVLDTATNSFVEKRLGVIGTDKMESPNRALQPNLVRNVNGQNKFSFKMYKRYIDTVTGEETENPFCDWLISERKIKLEYDGKWYDFVIKDIAQTSADYLYNYSLEDANVQELAKNGFGITLDAALMNNIGTAKDLGQYVMSETDWDVDGEVSVQTIEEPLVYVTIPEGTHARHLKDQVIDDSGKYSSGVTEDEEDKVFDESTTVLAFYSSCKSKPHRFQFIYSDNGYDKDSEGMCSIEKNDKRIITEKDCQYYIDFSSPESYSVHNATYDMYLPSNFSIAQPAESEKLDEQNDTVVSTWYRGARYGFSQQSVYVPLLEKYCQKFNRHQEIDLTQDGIIQLHQEYSANDMAYDENTDVYKKKTAYCGIKFELPYDSLSTYILEYTLVVKQGNLYRIGGHNWSFDTFFSVYDNDGTLIGSTTESYFTLPEPRGAETEIKVVAKYTPKIPSNRDDTPYIFIQPNRGLSGDNYEIAFSIRDLKLYADSDYLGYTETNYVSPAIIQNYVTDYLFEDNLGWYATSSSISSSADRPDISNAYGRFNENGEFKSLTDDFLTGQYSENNTYNSYMKMTFRDVGQFILNSGPYDNRTKIGNMPKSSQWVLDYKILNDDGAPVEDNTFSLSIEERIYSIEKDGYELRSGLISFETEEDVVLNDSGLHRIIFKVAETSFNEDNFKDSNIYIKIEPNLTNKPDSAVTYYLAKLAFYKKVEGNNGEIIAPDYEEEESEAAEDWASKSGVEKTYKYFRAWDIDQENPNVCLDKKLLSYETSQEVDYSTYVPVYNNGAEKIQTVTAKESNYFNILQTIAETFEQWLVLEITRNSETGEILAKKICFKNYRGGENQACFRYGVNLKDISRTFSTKNIVTKLMVKENFNELAENGFCSISRAHNNPTGENCIYDFQYYQNTGIMPADEYLTTNYYLTGAMGPDLYLFEEDDEFEILYNNSTERPSEPESTYNTYPDYNSSNWYKVLSTTTPKWWCGTFNNGEDWSEVVPYNESNLNGYFLRLKKINSALEPLIDELNGFQIDLVKSEASKKNADLMAAAALSGIATTKENFRSLTGVYPEEAQDGKIKEINNVIVTPRENWIKVNTSKNDDGYTSGIKIDNSQSSVSIALMLEDEQEAVGSTVHWHSDTEVKKLTSGVLSVEKNYKYGGLYVKTEWDGGGREYTLQYGLTWVDNLTEGGADSVLKSIGCHNACFTNGFKLTVTDYRGNEIVATNNGYVSLLGEDGQCLLNKNEKYLVTITGQNQKPETIEYQGQDCLWIQPNREFDDFVICKISDIVLYKTLTGSEVARNDNRTANIYISADINIEASDKTPVSLSGRLFSTSYTVPANATSATIVYPITAIDRNSQEIRTYLEEYTTQFEKYEEAIKQQTRLESTIEELQESISEKKEQQKLLKEYKAKLNKLFFNRYSRFIQEGTWINEEYVDDDKYYTDAQSVLYHSCYPQTTYVINVLEISNLPGYELFKFDLGEKTWVIDDEFFGEGKKQEVIISEFSEMLDDPTQNNIKVQSFKNQFQDLFQKITATVQQTQYNEGAYRKGQNLLDASVEKQSSFITNAINNAKSYLNYGQDTVVSDNGGITITDQSSAKRQLRLVGGAILFSTTDPTTKETTWCTGLTNEGISAELIKAGRINTREIQIMATDTPTFRWDEKGISAYDALWNEVDGIKSVSGIDSTKFVRFDKYGVYGINRVTEVDGKTWYPTSIDEIDEKATFALTWEGLKVTGNDGVVARIGKLDNNILNISRTESEEGQNVTKNLMSFSKDGSLKLAGFYINEKDITIYGKDEEGNDNNTIVGFISKGEQDGYYAVGESGLKQNWFLWNRGAESETETDSDGQISGPKGTFGVDINGNLYASGDGQIGNWTLSDGKLYYQDDKILLSPDGTEVTIDEEKKKLVLKAGDDFYVDVNGAIYANAGKIGTMEIGQLVKQVEQVANKNLATGTANNYPANYWGFNVGEHAYNGTSGVTLTADRYQGTTILKWNGNASYDAADVGPYISVSYLIADGYEWDKTYTLSLWLKADYETTLNLAGLAEKQLLLDDYSDNVVTTEWKRFSVSFVANQSISNICIYTGKGATEGASQVYMCGLKIEEGRMSTPWCLADEEIVQTNVNTNEFSWKFSPSEGMLMWNGEQGTGLTKTDLIPKYATEDRSGIVENSYILTQFDFGKQLTAEEKCILKFQVRSSSTALYVRGTITEGNSILDEENRVIGNNLGVIGVTRIGEFLYIETDVTLPVGSRYLTIYSYDIGENYEIKGAQIGKMASADELDSNIVFKVSRDNLYMNGTINAFAGNIGGFQIINKPYTPDMPATDKISQRGAPGLRYITNILQTPSNEYNGYEFGRIELVSRDGDGDNKKESYRSIIEPNEFSVGHTNASNGYYNSRTIITDTDISVRRGDSSTSGGGVLLQAFDDKGTITFENLLATEVAGYIRGKEITLQTEKGNVKVSDLVFKEPYNLYWGGKVVGTIMQFGPIVYGHLVNKIGGTPNTNDIIYIGASNYNAYNMPAPYTGSHITWFSNNSSRPNGHAVSFIADGSNLKIYVSQKDQYECGSNNDTDYSIHWSYFCYTASSTGHANPN